jgi:hypothetical protein
MLHTDLQVRTIREEITQFNVKYRDKIPTHSNVLASTLLEEEELKILKSFKPTDLTTRSSKVSHHRYGNIHDRRIFIGILLCKTFTE